jgi:hypothetical protein
MDTNTSGSVTPQYSLKKGLIKGAIGVLVAVAFGVSLTTFSDQSIWGLLETYLKPIIGSLTVSGAFAMGINALKFKLEK